MAVVNGQRNGKKYRALENDMKMEKGHTSELEHEMTKLEGKLSLQKKEKDMVDLEGRLKEIFEAIQF